MTEKPDIICDINELAQLAPLSIMCFNCEGRITFINDWHLKNFARDKKSRENYLGELITNLPGIVSSGLADQIEEVLHGEAFRSENVFTSEFSGGQSGYQSIRAIPVKKDGKVVGGIVMREDVTKFILSEKKLVDTERKVSTLINATEDSAILIDSEGTFLTMNKEAARRRCLEVKDLIGKSLFDYLPDNGAEARVRAVKKVVLTHEPEHYKETSGDMTYQVSVHPIVNDSGEVKELATYSRDISEQANHESQLIQAKERAESVDMVKSQFLANVSHELRTPLNGILGMSQIALMEEIPSGIANYLRYIEESANRLTKTINNIIDLADIESRACEPIVKDFDLHALIKSVCSSYSVQSKLKNINLLCAINDDVPTVVVGDEYRLRQILVNLLSNAVQCTNEGQITLAVIIDSSTSNKMYKDIRFSVNDTGIGIDSEYLSIMFDSFALTESVLTKSRSGIGVGLTIARSLVTMLGGKLHVESEVGVGSKFFFTLQLHAPHDETNYDLFELLSEASKIDLKGTYVVLAEDEEINRIYALHILHGFGCTVFTAQTGTDVLSILSQQKVDLILMDIQMPMMDGIEATIHIRNGEIPSHDRNVPIIALTAYASDKDRARFLAIGMNELLPKPFGFKQLERVMKNCLDSNMLGSY